MAKIVRPKRKRVNLRIPAELLDWAKEFSRNHNISLTQIIINCLISLKDECDETERDLRRKIAVRKITSNAR